MKILIEGEYYPIKTLQNIFEDPKFYIQNGLEGKITSVGYYHSFEKNELVYMLPKVFMIDNKMSIFNKTTSDLLELDNIQNIKHDKQYNWIRQSSIYFYNSLLEYRKRISDTGINKNQTFELNTNIGNQEYSYLDLLLTFVNFYKKNKNHILYKHIEFTSNQVKKPKWDKTIRKSLPLMSSNNQPIYISIRNKKKVINTEEELISYFFSILNRFNKDHNLSIKINKSYKIYKGHLFEKLQKNGLSKLRRIKHRYFNDTLKRMYHLCEIYFSQTDTSSSKRKREDFLSVTNYNLVFEDMVDKLFSDKLNSTIVNNEDVSLNSLKKNKDGKIIDHIYDYQSLLDTSNIFYIGDSKYYKSNEEAGSLSKYKQFTYAKNVIQFNIDLLNKDKKKPYKQNIRYRDKLTEGYNITPNFFIYGFIPKKENMEEHFEDRYVSPYREIAESYQWEYRLFDRDTLFVHQYRINFLFVLKAYTSFNSIKTQEFRSEVKINFRKRFIDFFNDSEACKFKFYKFIAKYSEYETIVRDNFKSINGKCFLNIDGELIIAEHNKDTIEKSIMVRFERIPKLE